MLNSVRVQVTKAFSLYSDIARCPSLLLLDYQSAKHSTSVLLKAWLEDKFGWSYWPHQVPIPTSYYTPYHSDIHQSISYRHHEWGSHTCNYIRDRHTHVSSSKCFKTCMCMLLKHFLGDMPICRHWFWCILDYVSIALYSGHPMFFNIAHVHCDMGWPEFMRLYFYTIITLQILWSLCLFTCPDIDWSSVHAQGLRIW